MKDNKQRNTLEQAKLEEKRFSRKKYNTRERWKATYSVVYKKKEKKTFRDNFVNSFFQLLPIVRSFYLRSIGLFGLSFTSYLAHTDADVRNAWVTEKVFACVFDDFSSPIPKSYEMKNACIIHKLADVIWTYDRIESDHLF